MLRAFRLSNRHVHACVIAALTIALGGLVAMRAQTATETFSCPGGFTEEIAPAIPLASLTTVPNPVIPRDPMTNAPMIREDLVAYVANLNAAIRLGKALYWDMQAGSDNEVACATCHFNAGGDARSRNQLHPGPNASWDFQLSANALIGGGDYPYATPGVDRTDNITGSQGVRRSTFGGLTRSGVEQLAEVSDPVFNVGGTNVRQVTGRNAPSTVNAVFNARNFHDGRAQSEFNGVNPFGNRDTAARVWSVGPLGPTQIDIHISGAGLASQAVGPPLSDVEMSAIDRRFPDLGRKLLALKPLGRQKVDPTDSVLGAYADPVAGLTTTYKAMIQAAFKATWWNTKTSVRVNGKSYSVMEANFSLFWGLSVMLYEATLVSDQTPMDRYLASRTAGAPDPSLLDPLVAQLQADYPGLTRDNILHGLALFELPPPPQPAPNGVGCMLCHVGAELSSASSRNINHGVEPDDIAFTNAGFEQRLERMFMQIPPVAPGTDTITLDPLSWTVTAWNSLTPGVAPWDVPVATYDTGYYNIGVRPTADDPGGDGNDPFGHSWSIVRLLQQTIADPSWIKVPGGSVNCGPGLTGVVKNATGFPMLSGSLRRTERVAVAGTFKVPNLRNVELTGPYFHNGGKATLLQVVEMYDDGGDFQNPTLAPLIRPLGMSPDDRRDLVAFMLALTDERVRYRRAPFDHPQLLIPNGDLAPGLDDMIELPAVGAGGAGLPLQRFLNLNPFQP